MRHPFLTGKKIYLRALEEKDIAGDYFQWFNDMNTCRYNSHAVFPNSEKRMREYLADVSDTKSAVVFAIVEKKTDRHVGNVSIQNIDWISRSAEIAFIIDARHAGKGYGYEAGRMTVDYAFERLNLVRVYCGTSSENVPMQKLAAKLGMKREGIRQKAMYKMGKYADIYEYGVLREEV